MKYILVFLLFIGIISCVNPSEEKPIKNNFENTSEKQKTFPKLDTSRYNVGFLIMDGTYNTELTAPYDIFQQGRCFALHISEVFVTMLCLQFSGVYQYKHGNLGKPHLSHHQLSNHQACNQNALFEVYEFYF